MLKKENIVKKNWEFQKIIGSKKQYLSKYLILYYLKNTCFKIGISIPKKFANAAKRNYLRRQIRAIIAQKAKILNLNYNVVLIIRKDFINLNFEEKKYYVYKIFSRLDNYVVKEDQKI